MKKLVYTSLLLFLLIFSSKENLYSQFGWYWSYPNPVGSHLEDVFFINVNTGYAVGWNGSIIKTTNGGINWIQTEIGTNFFCNSVYFTSLDTGYIAISNNNYPSISKILKTTNAGENWCVQSTFNNRSINSISFLNSKTGFIAASNYAVIDGFFYKTTNSGENWSQLLFIQYNAFHDVKFLNDSIGFIAADDRMVYRTTNGGINWQSVAIENMYYDFQSINFINLLTGYIVGSGGAIFKTINGGNNWFQQNTGIISTLRDIKFKNNYTGFITGELPFANEGGFLLRTTNGGLNWDSINYGISQDLIGLEKINDSIFIAVGHFGTIVKTTNNGNNFTFLNGRENTYDINSIDFINNYTGYSVGTNSSIMKTTNQGESWTYNSLGYSYIFNSVCFVNYNTGFIAGGDYQYIPPYSNLKTKIYKTTNAGTNWILIYGNNNELGIASKILFLNQNTGFSTYYKQSSPGGILKTTNCGINWINIIDLGDLYDIYFQNNTTGFSCGFLGKILKTTNAGENWITLNSEISNKLYSIFYPSSDTGYATGYHIILKTTNGGVNWGQQYSGIQYNCIFNSSYFRNNNTGYMFGQSDGNLGTGSLGGGIIIKTTNGGINWIQLTSAENLATNMNTHFHQIDFIDSNTAFICGSNGSVLKNTNVFNPIGIRLIGSSIPSYFSLSQNYPNPFNPSTTIKFDIPKSSNVQIVVYDMLGREVDELLNEERKPGSYEVRWDGSRYSSGVYFYKIISDEFVETKKMILIK
ncbi:MAG: T9SS C-terminal target domain-containing protein [Ignavibacteriae bacterium]|nr:MAG: T9SS C-terminal target domain-containing protein [Ignavibacteriota bacterium]